jgi:hypothetical protein
MLLTSCAVRARGARVVCVGVRKGVVRTRVLHGPCWLDAHKLEL